jgi:RND family efflux transporter MFP subunit
MRLARRFLLPLTAWLPVLLLAGCGEQPAEKSSGAKGPPRNHLVVAVTAARAPVSTAHQRTGTLRARRIARIYNQEEGRISHLPYFESDRVKQGELLIRLEDDLLRAELAKAKATTRQARQDLARIENLVRKLAASEDEQARLRTRLEVAAADQLLLETRLGFTRISAPFDGIVSARLAEPGDVMPRNNHILTLTDLGSLVAEIHVSELLLPRLANGDPVRIRIDALGDRVFTGRIQRIHPTLDPLTRQGVVEVELKPVPEGARPGQFARITLQTAESLRMLIPFAAVRRDGDGEFVYQLSEERKAVRTPVRSGIRLADRIEIIEGLQPGDQVITRGFLGLSAGKKVKPVENKNRGDTETGR